MANFRRRTDCIKVVAAQLKPVGKAGAPARIDYVFLKPLLPKKRFEPARLPPPAHKAFANVHETASLGGYFPPSPIKHVINTHEKARMVDPRLRFWPLALTCQGLRHAVKNDNLSFLRGSLSQSDAPQGSLDRQAAFLEGG